MQDQNLELSTEKNVEFNPPTYWGAFKQDMTKGFKETIDPYEKTVSFAQDAFQPVSGVVNLFRATWDIFFMFRFKKGGLGAIKGVIEIVTSPLTWVFRMPFRSLRTIFGALFGGKTSSPPTKEYDELKDTLPMSQPLPSENDFKESEKKIDPKLSQQPPPAPTNAVR